MLNWSRLVFSTLVLAFVLLWTAPEAAAYVLVSGIEYSDDTGVVGGFSATWRDPWDSDFEGCYAEVYSWWYDQTFCTDYRQYTFWVSVDAYVAFPGDFVYVGSQTASSISLVGWGGYTENFGTWAEIGDHFYGRDAYYQACYFLDYATFYCEPWAYSPVQSYSAYLGTTVAQVVVRPRIIVSGGNTIWYFGGQNPAGWPPSTTLTSTGGGSTTWSVIEGGGKVTLSPPGQTSTVTVTSSASPSSGSAFFSLPPGGDIKITATANGVPSLPVSLTSRTPHRLILTQVPDNDCDRGLPFPPFIFVKYLVTIHYEILDNLGATLPPISIGVNEQLGTIVPIFSGNNWPATAETGFSTSTSRFNDNLWVSADAEFWTPPATCGTGTGVSVWERGQIWRIGSETIAAGRMVQSGLIRFYTDLADVVNIVSPLLP